MPTIKWLQCYISGTLWLWDIVCLLQSNKTDVQKRIFDTSNLELNSVERLDELPSPRVLQTHMRPKYLPRSFLERRSKIVYGVRNPRDVAVSLHSFMVKINDKWCQYRGSWASFLPLFHEGKGTSSWINHNISIKIFNQYMLTKKALASTPKLDEYYAYRTYIHDNCRHL